MLTGRDIEEIRPSTPADIPELRRLFLEVFGIDRPEDVWRWKYFEHPGKTASMLCEADGAVVAHCGGTPVRILDSGVEYAALQSVDFMSSSKYPGGIGRGGVFMRTANAFFSHYCGPDKVPLVYGFPGERHRLLGERFLGYEPVEPIGELTLSPENERTAVEPLTREVFPLFGNLPVVLGGIRDAAYLDWRYLRHPLHRYGVVGIRQRFRKRFRVAAIVRETEQQFFLMEVGGVEKGREREALKLLTSALRGLGKPVEFWCSLDHPVSLELKRAGFTASHRDHQFEVRYFVPRPRPPRGTFYYTYGDYDVH